jgi:hypothetical protein
VTLTPVGAAKIANAQRALVEILQRQMCPYAESAARQVMDELRRLGWSPPGRLEDEVLPQPSTSTPQGRARAREIYEQTRREAANRIDHKEQ